MWKAYTLQAARPKKNQLCSQLDKSENHRCLCLARTCFFGSVLASIEVLETITFPPTSAADED